MNITVEQGLLIGLLATVIVQGLKLGVVYFGWQINRQWLTGGLYVVSLVPAYFWLAPVFPAPPVSGADPSAFMGLVLAWLGQLLTISGAVFGFATMIYNLLLAKVFEALGWTKDAPK